MVFGFLPTVINVFKIIKKYQVTCHLKCCSAYTSDILIIIFSPIFALHIFFSDSSLKIDEGTCNFLTACTVVLFHFSHRQNFIKFNLNFMKKNIVKINKIMRIVLVYYNFKTLSVKYCLKI